MVEGDVLYLTYILYSFLVGGDRNVYEGRGWNFEPPRYPEDTIENAYVFNGKCIEIAFIDKHSKYLLIAHSKFTIYTTKVSKERSDFTQRLPLPYLPLVG